MNSGICVCVLLAILSTSCLGRLSAGSDDEGSPVASELDQSLSVHQRQVRAATSNGQLKTAEGNMEQRANLGPLLARYLKQARKGSSGRNLALSSKSQTLDLNHRINDRDYMGWMDFGRRSAEEYDSS
uniref:Cholecystokinin n=1 Tax=Acipenser baerii TaxID=27689 RepID=A0A482FBU9_ACIBE|nr:cholecystokinin [Acipenser baerii]